MGTNEDLNGHLEDAGTVLLVRDAMARTTADLPAIPDLAGPARAQGRRRKARLRAAIGGGAVAVAAIAVAGAFALPGTGTGTGATGVGVAAPPPSSQAQPQPPVHLEPSPGESSMADLPPAERARQENFQNQAVVVLQELLPPTVGTVQRTDLSVRLYRATKDGKTFDIIFSVRPSGADRTDRPCLEVKGQVCKRATLPGGIEATAATAPVNNGDVAETRLSFHYGQSNVSLSVSPHDASGTSAPVTGDQLLELAKAPGFLDLVKAADSDPVEQEQKIIPGG